MILLVNYIKDEKVDQDSDKKNTKEKMTMYAKISKSQKSRQVG